MSGASADRGTGSHRLRRGGFALLALGIILVITALWWTLALWPAATSGAGWLARTREVCFGALPGGLPDAGGWVLLIGEPIGLVGFLIAAWGDALRRDLRWAAASWPGRAGLLGTGLLVLVGLRQAAEVVAEARGEPFAIRSAPTPEEMIAAGRVNDSAPALVLVDQTGARVDLAGLRGRPVVVTFGYGHCVTVCPVTVRAARVAAERVRDHRPVVLVVTLDPWRDTPARLPAVAAGWALSGEGMHLLGGEVDEVERTLSAWRIPRARNGSTGEVSHPAIVYVVSPEGRIAYALGADPDAIAAALRSFPAAPGA